MAATLSYVTMLTRCSKGTPSVGPLSWHELHLAKECGVKSLLSKRKRKIDNVFLLMLMSVPSVSERIATALVAKWPTLRQLQQQLETQPNALRDIRVTAKRKIGPAVIKSLQTFLL